MNAKPNATNHTKLPRLYSLSEKEHKLKEKIRSICSLFIYCNETPPTSNIIIEIKKNQVF